MNSRMLKKRIDIAAGRIPADLVIKNTRIVDVYQAVILEGLTIAISDGYIAGIGDYIGREQIDANGQYALPGLIDGHIHIESSYLTPVQLGRLIVPCGTTTIVADPHEIANVCGIDGVRFMLNTSEKTKLDIKLMMPTCVPVTRFEHAGAIMDAAAMKQLIGDSRVLGLAEFMDYPGIINASDGALEKLMVAYNTGKLVDGHCPGISGKALDAYITSGIHTDHECLSVVEMEERISKGMYILLREGSACHDLRSLLKKVTHMNSRRCVLCSDDRQPETILSFGHMDHHLRICIEEGIDPILAIQMASLNAAECFGLRDRGAIAPGLRADITLVEDLVDFHVKRVFILGEEVAKDGQYLSEVEKCDISEMRIPFRIKDFTIEKLNMKLKSGRVNVIEIIPGSVETKRSIENVKINTEGQFEYNQQLDIVKVAVIERHQNTGNVAVGLLKNYGIKSGAIAISIAHDSHNIIATGTNDEDMTIAVCELTQQGGGIVLVNNTNVVGTLPMEIGGIMSNESGEWVKEKLKLIHETAYEQLGVNRNIEPIMTLCFMALAVIPEIKLTDVGLFDVTSSKFISVDENMK